MFRWLITSEGLNQGHTSTVGTIRPCTTTSLLIRDTNIIFFLQISLMELNFGAKFPKISKFSMILLLVLCLIWRTIMYYPLSIPFRLSLLLHSLNNLFIKANYTVWQKFESRNIFFSTKSFSRNRLAFTFGRSLS